MITRKKMKLIDDRTGKHVKVVYLEVVGGVADLLGNGRGGVGRCVGVCDLAGAGCGVIVTGVAVTDGDWVNECDECDVGEGLLWVAKRCSISCSCCNAFTNAVFSRFVCSAFSAFFTLVVTHCSQIIFESLPT